MGDEKRQVQLAVCTKSGCQGFITKNLCENLGTPQMDLQGVNNKVQVLLTEEDQVYIEKIIELHAYLDSVKKMVKPGCSEELLKVALSYMSSLVKTLSSMSLTEKLHASL